MFTEQILIWLKCFIDEPFFLSCFSLLLLTLCNCWFFWAVIMRSLQFDELRVSYKYESMELTLLQREAVAMLGKYTSRMCSNRSTLWQSRVMEEFWCPAWWNLIVKLQAIPKYIFEFSFSIRSFCFDSLIWQYLSNVTPGKMVAAPLSPKHC